MTLTSEQQELLHAWVDGETTAAEGEAVKQLLAESEPARDYTAELKRLRKLLATYGGVQAPRGLRARVCEALKLECEAPVHQLPLINWRTLGLAVAAAVVVSIALVFGPSLTTDDNTAGTGEIATHETETGDRLDPGSLPFESKLGKQTETHQDDDVKRSDRFWAKDAGPNDSENGAAPKNTLPPEREEMEDGYDSPNKNSEGATRSTLSLDRTTGQPVEISVNLNRKRDASTLQVYNDMLMVSCLYGDAQLRDAAEPQPADKELNDEFDGRDFSEFDGLEVEVEADELPALLAALNRMADDQGYGNVVAPGYMRREIEHSRAEVEGLRDVADFIESKIHPNARAKTNGANASRKVPPGAQGYLPPDVQRECLRKQATDEMQLEKLNRALDDDKERDPRPEGANPDPDVTKGTHGDHRKVKLVIRLR
ncbi:MAG: hypothetical protein KDB82_15700 [Planctomycetes bacterium]|nr:hypothetical protein [Planctomycetota bacterium]